MQFGASLKKLLTAFVGAYQTYFKKTFKLALAFTLVCFIIAILINALSNADDSFRRAPTSILSYFFTRYSFGGTYNFVDIIKTIFIFFVSILSISLLRNERDKTLHAKLFPFNISFKDIAYLFAILIACFFLDVELVRMDSRIFHASDARIGDTRNFYLWVYAMIFQLRIYLPLVLFSLIIQIRVTKADFNTRKIIFLLVSLWLCNEVSYEFVVAVRSYFFGLVLSPITNPEVFYYAESVLGVALVASLFAGYYCAMTAPFRIMEDDKATD